MGKSNPAVFRQLEVVQAAGAQGNQDKVDDGDAGKTDGTSLGQGQGSFLAFLDLEALDGRNNRNPEGQSSQGIQGVVDLQEAVGQRSSEVVGASLRTAGCPHWLDSSDQKDDEKQGQERWVKDFANPVGDLPFAQRAVVNDAEENS